MQSMLSPLFALGAITAVLILITIFIYIKIRSCGSGKSRRYRLLSVFIACSLCLQILVLTGSVGIYFYSANHRTEEAAEHTPPTESATQTEDTTAPTTIATENTEPETLFSPLPSHNTIPENFRLNREISVNGQIVDSFERDAAISFERDAEYFALPGIATFRGNNYRDGASYGTAVVEEASMEIVWRHSIGAINTLGGCGWTGQPLLVQWDMETKSIMTTMYESKAAKEDLVEVIYATLDGYIHFYDLEDGSLTRDPIHIGMYFMGSGSLDPRGYPLLYVGASLSVKNNEPRMYVIDLITGNIIYEYGNDDSFALRDWSAFDSSPLVDAESDTLIWPGENGVLYTIKLNTIYDKASGTISVTPDEPVKMRYTSYYSEVENRTLGYQASAAVVDHYLFSAENSGLIQCIDLNSMEILWAQDLMDQCNSSPVFQWGDDSAGYLYVASSLNWTAENHEGMISICKLDALTGDILWKYNRECLRYDDIAGGVLSTPILGREGTDMDGLIVYSISRTPSAYRGVLIALDTDTGEKIWEISSGNYAWSSPVAMYTKNGDAYIFLANASGVARLVDGSTGEVLDTLDLKQTVEASPVVFGNMLIIGTRQGVYGIRIS